MLNHIISFSRKDRALVLIDWLVDLAKPLNRPARTLFLVAPDGREKEIQAQLRRPSFKDLGLPLLYLLFSDLNCHCEGMCRIGEDYRVLLKLARGIDASAITPC